MAAVHFDDPTEATSHVPALLAAAERGLAATVRRDGFLAAVVDAARLRHCLAAATPSRAEAVPEADGWSIFIPGLPVAADGATFEEAVAEMVAALREYAQDWQDHLLDAPNHRDNWALVQLISLSDDRRLAEWVVGEAGEDEGAGRGPERDPVAELVADFEARNGPVPDDLLTQAQAAWPDAE
ncbi:prevent-host-death protein [Streptomonospora sp. S1-112]|uniref:Prevent-host-death protein n=1 Tax=Streptomonospora mangrovi TaxID=2883123 RepID=A0A9X3NLU9_9ACTN|nr:prevent-host-death protein [Streptomonospora mangrovi]MDA0566134.1 prevent-host-death protein [Streptomonospora mangrovi]